MNPVRQPSTKSGSTSRTFPASPDATEGPSGSPVRGWEWDAGRFPPELMFPSHFPAGSRARSVWGRTNGGALAALPACPGDVAMAAPGAAPARGRSGGLGRAPRSRPCLVGGSEGQGDLLGAWGSRGGLGRALEGLTPGRYRGLGGTPGLAVVAWGDLETGKGRSAGSILPSRPCPRPLAPTAVTPLSVPQVPAASRFPGRGSRSWCSPQITAVRGMDGGRAPQGVAGALPEIAVILTLVFPGRDHHPGEAEAEVHGQGAGSAQGPAGAPAAP